MTFFTQLGNITENHLTQTSSFMVSTADMLVQEICSIAHIAEEERELQVYLIELQHITMTITQVLARALKNWACSFLVVLTAGYDRLDFVLLEFVLPRREQSGISPLQVYLRPCVMTMNLRNPIMVVMHALQ